jgi:hypothetical protein
MLILLEELQGQNYLSMSPDPEGPSPDPLRGRPRTALPDNPTDPGIHINCYVLNLARFNRRAINGR